jgi:hypothetical protein
LYAFSPKKSTSSHEYLDAKVMNVASGSFPASSYGDLVMVQLEHSNWEVFKLRGLLNPGGTDVVWGWMTLI